ncbi:MAG: transposase [Selenomonadales bacterium]|nr:transposase [Selenomonadales bacterium]
MFIDCPPTLAPQQIANQLKGYTSRILRAELWSRSYYLGSAGNVSSETIQRYIEQQRRS